MTDAGKPSRAVSAIVIGGGFYGARIALAIRRRGDSVLLLERELQLLARASLRNQARVHNGYHYPRSILTALRSRVNYTRFLTEYPECIADDFTHYYAIARDSRVTASQFAEFCHRIEAPISPASAAIRQLFDPARVDGVFEVRECAFDATRLRTLIERHLAADGVESIVGARVFDCRPADDGGVVVRWVDDTGNITEATAPFVFNCTYSSINSVLAEAGLEEIPMKRELAELALVEAPAALSGIGVTVMDGPFFSLMPYPPRAGLCTLSHVRYTPHCAWLDITEPTPADAVELRRSQATRFPHMIRDAARYLPAMRDARYVDSLWETKALMPRSEWNDSRPILFRPSREIPGLISVLGAKIDSVYDVEESALRLMAAAYGVSGHRGTTGASRA